MAAVIDFPYSVNDGEYSDAESVYSALVDPTTGDIWFSPCVTGDSLSVLTKIIRYIFVFGQINNANTHHHKINALRAHQ